MTKEQRAEKYQASIVCFSQEKIDAIRAAYLAGWVDSREEALRAVPGLDELRGHRHGESHVQYLTHALCIIENTLTTLGDSEGGTG